MHPTLITFLVGLSLASSAAWSQAAPGTGEPPSLEQRIQRAIEAAERASSGSRSVRGPRLENLPVPTQNPAAIDLGVLAERYREASQPMAREAPALLALVSLSMPRASLERLVIDAERTGATLVMRGLHNNSIRETMEAASRLIGERHVAWTIDPEIFTRFGIHAVPSYVLLPSGISPRECGSGQCFTEDSFVRISGDVPIDYALERIEQGAPAFAATAHQFRRSR